LLLSKGYIVVGMIRRSSSFNTGRIEHLYNDSKLAEAKPRLLLEYGDLTDSSSLMSIIGRYSPHEIYNLAAQSHVKVSFDMPEYTADADGIGLLRILIAIRTFGLEKKCKLYQASTSELYGKVVETPQKETTPFYPRSPYAVAKLAAFWTCVNFREAYSIFAVNGILFNHESPRRGPTFVTRKITRAVARIKRGLQSRLIMGNIDSLRDWGHARDYAEGMWRIMQHEVPEDFVLATGSMHTVREFLERAFACVSITLKWVGEKGAVTEVGVDASDETRTLVSIDPAYFRPTEVDLLLGDPSKALAKLGWKATTKFEDLVREMVAADLFLVDRGDLTM
jgi:GDPmannose 4,6-dehydratase